MPTSSACGRAVAEPEHIFNDHLKKGLVNILGIVIDINNIATVSASIIDKDICPPAKL